MHRFGFISNFKGVETVALAPNVIENICDLNDIRDHAQEIEEKLLFLPPLVASHIKGLTETGYAVDGYFAFVTLTADQMIRLSQIKHSFVLSKIQNAIDELAERDCNIIGLGSLTGSGITGNGLQLKKNEFPYLTSGNTFAAMATVMSVEEVVRRLSLDFSDLSIGVVGATGSIGCAVAHEIASFHPQKMILVSTTQSKLSHLKDELALSFSTAVEASTDINAIQNIDLLVVTTAAAGNIVPLSLPKSGMIIVDETQPSNISPEFQNRQDILKIDGAFIFTPHIDYGMNMDCPTGMIYACLAETIMLNLYGVSGHFGLGRVDPNNFPFMRELAKEYGMGLAPFHSFGQPITQERLTEFRTCLGNKEEACSRAG